MKKKCLFIASEYPFPARNGVTIPTANYIKLINENDYIVDLVLMNNDYKINIEKNKYLNEIFTFATSRNPFKAIIKEITLQVPYFNAYEYDKKRLENIIVDNGPYDLLIASPINVAEVGKYILRIHNNIYNNKIYSIAAISDCYTTASRSKVETKGLSLKIKSHYFILHLRSYLMPILEYKTLKDFDKIFLQTKKDEEELNKHTHNKLSSKIDIVTNGVNEELFKIHNTYLPNFIYVATLKSVHYQNNLLWLYNNVWKIISKEFPEAKLYIYTGGTLEEKKFYEIIHDKSIILTNDFVENIRDVYINKSICFAPIFKENGFMNKVAEAMAAELVVIGDKSAFNGIDYTNNENVLIANNADEFLKISRNLLLNKDELKRLSKNSKYLASKKFHWKNKFCHFKENGTI